MAGLASSTAAPDEADLARRAAAGDGDAFATLYERYEGRAYNLCYRIIGSQDDAADATQEAFVSVLRRLPKLEGRDLAFGSYLFTSARNACYDLIQRRRRAEPSDEIPEHATPVGGAVGGGGIGPDPGDPEDDPERNVLLEADTEEIRAANLTLPERQREALALRELEELSYDEIADIMEMNRNSVAQLISRARINLRDALRGSALASVAAGSPECERALPLIALQQDGQLDDDSPNAEWLGDHLIGCDTCRLGREAMQEAGVSYRAWLPITAGPLLLRETMAEAAELVGADWSEVIARTEAARKQRAGSGGSTGGGPGLGRRLLAHRIRDLALVVVLAALLLLVGLVGAASDDEPVVTEVPVAKEEPVTAADPEPKPKPDKPAKEKAARRQDEPQPAAGAPEERAEEPDEADEPADEPPSGDDPAPAKPVSEPERRRSEGRGNVERTGDGDTTGGLTPGVTPDPPPPPPPSRPPEPPQPPQPPEPPPPPPPEEPPTCVDAAGRPCSPPEPPPRGGCTTPSAPNCTGGRPPRP